MKLYFFSIIPYYFNKLEKNKILLSYFTTHFPLLNQTGKCFPTYFSLHYQTSENNSFFWNSLSNFPTNKQTGLKLQ
jgi:hypothetical protein